MDPTKKAKVKSFPIALLDHALLVQANASAFVIRSDREAVKSRRKGHIGTKPTAHLASNFLVESLKLNVELRWRFPEKFMKRETSAFLLWLYGSS